MQPKRILHVTSVLNLGGIETFIMNIFRSIDREKLVFDFLVVREDNGVFESEILSLGGKIYKIPALKKSGYFSFKKALNDFFSMHREYDTVHCHLNAISSIVLKAAKENGIEKRIAHAHTAFPKYSFTEKLIKNFFKKSIKKHATDFLACSTGASDWLYGKDFKLSTIIKNAIDTKLFSFSQKKRAEIRQKLNIANKFVIINVGRFSKEKNHSLLIKIFKEVLYINPNSVLICIGDGKLKEKIKKEISSSALNDKIIILNARLDVYDFLCASDVYVSTSTFEGFGNSAVEAQFNSLPCILSDGFSNEVDVSKNCKFLSSKSSPKEWATIIANSSRENILPLPKCSYENFDISATAKVLTDFYFKNN